MTDGHWPPEFQFMKIPGLFPALIALTACAPSRPAAPEPPPANPPATAVNQPETRNQKPETDLYGDPLPPGAIARMGTIRYRLTGGAHSVVISPNGKTLASWGGNTIRLCEVTTGKGLLSFEGH
jgi:hypothetical protein